MLFTFSVSGWELINKKKSISKYSKECLYNMYKKINRTKTFALKPFLWFSSHILSGFGPIDPMSGRVGPPPPARSIKWLLDLVAVGVVAAGRAGPLRATRGPAMYRHGQLISIQPGPGQAGRPALLVVQGQVRHGRSAVCVEVCSCRWSIR